MPNVLRSILCGAVLGVSLSNLLGCGSPLVDSARNSASPRVGRYSASVPADSARSLPTDAQPTSLSNVPDAPAASVVRIPHTQEESRFHEVQAGESLTSIARRYDQSVAALRQANGLAENETLKTGQFLLVPK